jgi:hypothetical protein
MKGKLVADRLRQEARPLVEVFRRIRGDRNFPRRIRRVSDILSKVADPLSEAAASLESVDLDPHYLTILQPILQLEGVDSLPHLAKGLKADPRTY